mmetsp:Transcript_11414/g.12795  ORF Transcript_11414/g.12795 Transcript_11414/m.12795 type:complete len:144 (-) Transcript_11414:13-444(-)
MFPRALDGTMMVGMYEAVNSWEHSQLVVMSYGVLLSTVGATAKIIGRKNGLLVLGIALALLLVIPAKFAQHLSTLTMQFAYELGKYLERPQQQAMFYNITSAAMRLASPLSNTTHYREFFFFFSFSSPLQSVQLHSKACSFRL